MAYKSRYSEKMKSISPNKGNKDERFWSEDFQQDGSYRIRPVCDGKFNMFIDYTQHTVDYKDANGMDKKYTCVCPRIRAGEECPICDKAFSVYKTKDEELIDKMKKWISTKNVKVINIRVLENQAKPDEKGITRLMKINGLVWKIFHAQMNPDETTKNDPEFVDCNPFDPEYGLSMFYVYKKAKKGGRPSWEGTKFLKEPINILGNKVTEETAPTYAEKCEAFVTSKTYDLESYLEEKKKEAPTYDEIMKAIGTRLFGGMSKSNTQKSSLYETEENDTESETKDEELDNDLPENNSRNKSDDLPDSDNTETTVDDDDDLPF